MGTYENYDDLREGNLILIPVLIFSIFVIIVSTKDIALKTKFRFGAANAFAFVFFSFFAATGAIGSLHNLWKISQGIVPTSGVDLYGYETVIYFENSGLSKSGIRLESFVSLVCHSSMLLSILFIFFMIAPKNDEN